MLLLSNIHAKQVSIFGNGIKPIFTKNEDWYDRHCLGILDNFKSSEE